MMCSWGTLSTPEAVHCMHLLADDLKLASEGRLDATLVNQVAEIPEDQNASRGLWRTLRSDRNLTSATLRAPLASKVDLTWVVLMGV